MSTEVITDVAGLSSGFVTGATRTTVESQSLATFTLPSGAFLTGSSDVNGMVANSSTAGGTVQNTTTVNGTAISLGSEGGLLSWQNASGAFDCWRAVTPVRASTWGSVKTLYR